MTSSTDSPVWFITGCSTGLGHELARQVLARGWRAVVTARDKARLADLVQGAGQRALAVDLDVGNAGQIDAAVQAAHQRFGRIDVLVNNAGYGYMSSVEEGVEAQIRAQFDANVFGPHAAVDKQPRQAVAPRQGGQLVELETRIRFAQPHDLLELHDGDGETRFRFRYPGVSSLLLMSAAMARLGA